MGNKLIATEADIQKACMQWLNTLPGVRVWRANTGGMKGSHQGKSWFVKFGEKGQADITGIVGPSGIRIEIEVKRPGKEPTMNQCVWLDLITDHGGIAFWCDSLEACISNLRDEFHRHLLTWRKEWDIQ